MLTHGDMTASSPTNAGYASSAYHARTDRLAATGLKHERARLTQLCFSAGERSPHPCVGEFRHVKIDNQLQLVVLDDGDRQLADTVDTAVHAVARAQ